MTQAVTYQRETKAVAFQGKTIVLENLLRYSRRKKRNAAKKRLNAAYMMCSASTGTGSLINRNIAVRGY